MELKELKKVFAGVALDSGTLEEYKAGYCDGHPPYAEVLNPNHELTEDWGLDPAFFSFLTSDVHLYIMPKILFRIIVLAGWWNDDDERGFRLDNWFNVVDNYTSILLMFDEPDRKVLYERFSPAQRIFYCEVFREGIDKGVVGASFEPVLLMVESLSP